MIISAFKENAPETRVAITPSSAKQLINQGFKVCIEEDAGLNAGFSNEDYEQISPHIISNRKDILKEAIILLAVNEPDKKVLKSLKEKSIVIAPFEKNEDAEAIYMGKKNKLSLFSMNLIPRISRAQSMDSLSSQANLAGYRAVLEAVHYFKRALPMMMTAAGMIHPAKVLILGAGVAGLQAIATAKRLGAVVYAFDVRRAAKEQVESLGAEFIEVGIEEDSETAGGYAKESSEEYKQKQAALIDDFAQQVDIIITTALIPGRQAPVLIHRATVEKMKPGSVIVDLAASHGGNCELSANNEIIDFHGVTIVGQSNLAGLVPTTASTLYANNLLHLINLLAPKEANINFDAEDEIIQQALLCHEGHYLPFEPSKEKTNA